MSLFLNVSYGKGKTLEGTITSYECGDNCYLSIVDAKGKEHTGLCCEADIDEKSIGKKVRITVGKGSQYDGDGNAAEEMELFEKVEFISPSSSSSSKNKMQK